MMTIDQFIEKIQHLRQMRTDFVVVTLTDIVGSAPQDISAKIIIPCDGLYAGTVGGGKIEAYCIQYALTMLLEKKSSVLIELNLQKDIGMSCGGLVRMYFESYVFSKLDHVVVFGAGHIAQEFIPLLLRSQFQVTCIDSRKEWLDKISNHHQLNKIYSIKMDAEVEHIPDQAWICIMTMGHATDLPILQKTLPQRNRFKYVGCIGSDVKSKKLRKELSDLGLTNYLDFNCPMGENFGNNSPFEISISILAQILKMRDQ